MAIHTARLYRITDRCVGLCMGSWSTHRRTMQEQIESGIQGETDADGHAATNQIPIVGIQYSLISNRLSAESYCLGAHYQNVAPLYEEIFIACSYTSESQTLSHFLADNELNWKWNGFIKSRKLRFHCKY